jgi:DNA-binding winged helix-turn-helix (wHTH) protein/Tol biopolymer transport system component
MKINSLDTATAKNYTPQLVSNTALQAGFRLNEYVVSPATGEVASPNGVVTLEPKVMQVLLALVITAGDVMSAEQLFAKVWPKSIYSPVSVRRSINQLRKVFNDTGKVLLRTHPKLGYSLHAEITLTEQKKLHSQHQPVAQNTPVRGKNLLLAGFILLCTLLLLWYIFRQVNASWHVFALQPLTATAAEESFSLFTPDNSSVVYVSRSATEQGESVSELWLRSIDRKKQRLLYRSESPIEFFTWLQETEGATSQRLLVAAHEADDVRFFSLALTDAETDAETEAEPLSGRQEHFIVANSRISSPFFSTGHAVYFLAQQQGEQRLYRGDLTSGQIDLLLAPNQQFSPYRITTSAEDNIITLLGFDQQKRSQIKLLSITTGEISDVTTLDSNWYFIDYNKADGGYLLSDGKNLFRLDSQQQLSRLNFENYAFLHYPALAPSGRALTYTQAKIHGNVFSVDVSKNQRIQLTHASAHDWQGSYSADNRQLAYVSNKHGHSQVFVLDIATGTEQLVYDNSEQHLAISQPIWSADQTKLAFARNQSLVVVDLTTTTPTVEHFDQVIGLPAHWLATGDELLLSLASQPATRWFTFSVASKQQQQLTASHQPQVVYQGQRFQIGAQQLQDANGTVLFATNRQYHIAQHFVKSDGIYLLLRQQKSDNTAAEIWFFAYARESAEKIASLQLPDEDLSDISQHKLLYSSFVVEKDIHTLQLLRR